MFIVEAVVSGFISKAINDCGDISKAKIKRIVENKKHQNLESHIYSVIVQALNNITCNQYINDQDKIYEAAEVLSKGNEQDESKRIKACLYILCPYVDDNKCIEFKKLIYEEISRKDNIELFHNLLLMLLDQKKEFDQIQMEQLKQKQDEVLQLLSEIKSSYDKNIGSQNKDMKQRDDKDNKFQNNMKQHYIDNWNSRLFLHLDDDEKQLTLADAFIMPDYEIYQYSQKINLSENDTLDEMIEKFVNYSRTSTMLITGVPGMGKTTIVSWIAHKYETNDNLIILRFRDWESEDLDNGLLKAICNTLKCKRKDLNEKLLVLDGFDEIKSLDKRKQILNKFLNDIKDLEKSKIIITSRPTYIDSIDFQIRVELLRFDVEKIQRFYQKITDITLNENEVDKSNLDVIGIPVILYMAIMSNIDITKSSTKPELYNRIFAEKGGIFDRFYGYDSGSHIIGNPDNIKKYLKFLQDVAFKMFEKNDLSLLKKECEIPKLEFEGKNVSVLEFPIKHLFENTEDNIEFIHNSIYEYFVSEYILESISEIIKKGNFKVEDLAGVMGKLFKYRKLSFEIIEFLTYRVRNDKNFNDKFEIVKDAFDLMLKDGMTYYTYKHYKNVIDCEWRVFANMLEVMHLWKKDCYKFSQKVDYYIKLYSIEYKLNLSRIDLSGAYLRGANLSETDLSGTDLIKADLRGTDLRGAYLSEANLSGAYLSEADLSGAYLSEADLSGADLRGAYLSGADLSGAYLSGADLRGADLMGAYLIEAVFDEEQIVDLRKQDYNLQATRVYIKETREIINYEEYCKGKH